MRLSSEAFNLKSVIAPELASVISSEANDVPGYCYKLRSKGSHTYTVQFATGLTEDQKIARLTTDRSVLPLSTSVLEPKEETILKIEIITDNDGNFRYLHNKQLNVSIPTVDPNLYWYLRYQNLNDFQDLAELTQANIIIKQTKLEDTKPFLMELKLVDPHVFRYFEQRGLPRWINAFESFMRFVNGVDFKGKPLTAESLDKQILVPAHYA